jgi:hypothetical protein
MIRRVLMGVLAAALGIGIARSLAVEAQETAGAGDGPRYVNETDLARPDDYREWTFLSSSLDMTYDAPGARSGPSRFQNVFVNRSSYRAFLENGRWPDETIFVLEIRESSREGAINAAGQFQADLVALEAEVKDDRFADGWAFYDFGAAGSLRDVAEPLSGTRVARCIECHTEHTAAERTFVQFYPTLLEVARQKGTLKPGF